MVDIPTNGTAWTTPSERRLKENIVELDPSDILSRIETLPIYEYNYIGTDSNMKCRGPMAEEWHSTFPSSKNKQGIDTQDLDGIALASIKGLIQEVRNTQEMINELKNHTHELVDQINILTQKIKHLEG